VDGTALSGPSLDYVSNSGTLHFPANTTSGSFQLTILDDSFSEDAAVPPTVPRDPADGPDPNDPKVREEFLIQFTTDSPFASGRTKSVHIVDDEASSPPGTSEMTIEDAESTEGSCENVSAPESCGSLNQIEFTVTIDPGPPAGEISVFYETQDITATAGEDYEPVSGTLLFRTDDVTTPMTETVTVNILADRALEDDELFLLKLSDPSGLVSIADNSGIATISDDDYGGQAFGAHGATPWANCRRSLEPPTSLRMNSRISITTSFTGGMPPTRR